MCFVCHSLRPQYLSGGVYSCRGEISRQMAEASTRRFADTVQRLHSIRQMIRFLSNKYLRPQVYMTIPAYNFNSRMSKRLQTRRKIIHAQLKPFYKILRKQSNVFYGRVMMFRKNSPSHFQENSLEKNPKIVRSLCIVNGSIPRAFSWTNADLALEVVANPDRRRLHNNRTVPGNRASAALCTRVNLHCRAPSVFMRLNKSLVQRRELYIDRLV